MTKSKKQKKRDKAYREGKPISYDPETFDYAAYEHNKKMAHCKKDSYVAPGELKKGDTVCLVRISPKKKKDPWKKWSVQYVDEGNGFIQLGNHKKFDKEGAERNASFIRSHNFPITDIWNLDLAFTEFFLPRLKVFIESTRYSTPVKTKVLDNGETSIEGMSEEEWNDILIRMYEGLALTCDGDEAASIRRRLRKENPDANQSDLWQLESKMEQDGRSLFSQYFFDLWD